MLSVHILCVGKLKEPFYMDAVGEYTKRLGGCCKLTLTELPEEKLPQSPSQSQIEAALAKEGQSIRSKLPPNPFVVALCIEGKPHSSEDLAHLIRSCEQNSAKHLVFLIGSSYGLDPSIKQQAQVRLSMSPMTFPHHLARVMLLEQVYRAFKINEGSAYHK